MEATFIFWIEKGRLMSIFKKVLLISQHQIIGFLRE